MNTTTPYTPLECLLLFQSLVAYGTEDRSFARIADLLANNDLVKGGETYDAGRLTTEALRDLYLQLLGDELRSAEDGSQESTQPGSKKRKLQGAALPNLKEAQEHKEKLPILIERLYARYRDYMVREIRADEREYAQIKKDISEIERGEWDERILKEDGALATTNGITPPSAPQLPTNGTGPIVLAQEMKQPSTAPAAPDQAPKKASPPPIPASRTAPEADGLAISDILNGQPKAPAPASPKKEQVPVHVPRTAPPPKQQRPVTNGSPHPSAPPQAAPQPSGMAYKWEPPYQAGPPHQPPPYQSQPSSPYPQPQFNGPPPYPPQFVPHPRGPFPGQQGHPPPPPHLPPSPMNVQPLHPAHLPPPNAGRPPAGSPGVPLDSLADIAGQQYRATSGSPVVQQPLPVPPGGYPQQYPPPLRTPGKGQPQWNQQYVPPYQGTPPQFIPPSTQNQRQPFPPQPGLIPTENRQYNSPYNASQGPRPPATLPSQVNAPKIPPSLPNTPTAKTIPRFVTGSGTRWTPTPTGLTPRPYTLAKPPSVEPLSPILQTAKLIATAKATERQPPKLGAQKPKLAPTRASRRTRAGSTGSHRSTSAMSHADDADEASLASHVKEEVNTPLPLGPEEEAGDTTADESASLPTHRRQSSRQRYPAESPKRLKRKRDDSVVEPAREPAKPPTHVLWTRNFPKISTSAMESISGHRNASTFAAPVKERDAPGYKDIVHRPQDLKSIKSAILAGHRAAAEKEKSMGESTKSESSVWLPISEDLIPPKGIINSAQLEKELMRMFANAIMFNLDPNRGFGPKFATTKDEDKDKQAGDGYEIDEDRVVKDTKAMFADVEKIISGLRSTESVGVVGTLRGSSVGRAGSLRGSSVVPTEGDDDAASEMTGDGGDGSANVASAPKRRRKA